MPLMVISESRHLKQEILIQTACFWAMLCGVFSILFFIGILEFNSMMFFLDKFADESKSIVLQEVPLTFGE